MKGYKLFFLLPLILGMWNSSIFAHELHVAINGNDLNKGTISDPLATIGAAQQAFRKSGLLGKEICKVIIHQGTYRLDSPLRFSVEDSGSSEFPIIYVAANNDKVIITGANLILPNWELWKDGIYRSKIENIKYVDQLFINGSRQHMARYPNYGDGFVPVGEDKSVRGTKAGTVPYNGSAPNAWAVEKAKEWNSPKGAFMHGMHKGLWGSQHYKVLGKNKKGELVFEGGWQNNRSSNPHESYRMIENVFEELDAPGEWYYNSDEAWLYYKPATGIVLNEVVVEIVSNSKHLIEIYGDIKTPVSEMDIPNSGNGLENTKVKNYETVKPVRNIKFQGIRFAGTARSFMETIEPLLRSDWSVYRGGAIHMRGTEGIFIENCSFTELGGNAVFIDGYNRKTVLRENYFCDNGATDINFVGSFAAVREPIFNYRGLAKPINEVDTTIGPKTDEYPSDCLVENNLMMRCGRFEKQASGINISMSSRITLRHNTISHTPRAAINVCDGTWGGHLIEQNDCFETVLETHDHGAFNSWGRDRYWHPAGPSGPTQKDENGTPLISYWIEKHPNSPKWDAYQTTIIRNNRMQCDHGWDIDLDDGSTNYEIYNNLCLSGGLKTREGYHRIVTNNIVLGRGYTCNVPYPKPTHDVFEKNILWGIVYRSTNPLLWGGIRNYNFVHNPNTVKTVPAIGIQEQTKDDAESLYGNALFVAPEQGDFSIDNNSPAHKVGFKNFSMTSFGVTSTKLKELAGLPSFKFPKTTSSNVFVNVKTKKLLGADIKTLTTEAEITATGMFEKTGVLIVTLPSQSKMSVMGFKVDDVVLEIDKVKIVNENILIKTLSKLKKGRHKVKVWRNQEANNFNFKK